ncbi:hypothetical protein BDN71DRAFT_1593485 [Pleurotus eryngii]|uniref:Uncharacterized protein n=1 Tax=Pleurotus eryngii TaxID=5323 RepID=A0A9P5ZLC2_PLEER|nr:hypothetical protein BDN71DRAFT_1593485 [Pleurotus eryngii]
MKASSYGLLLFLSSASAMWFLSVEPTVINPGGSLNATVRVDGQDPPTCFLCIGPSRYDLTDGKVRKYCPEVREMSAILPSFLSGMDIAAGVLCGIVVVVALLAVAVCVWRRRKRTRKNGIAPYPVKIGDEVAYSDAFKPRRVLPDAAPIVDSSDRRIRYLQDQMRIIEAEMMKLERSRPDATNRRSGELLDDISRRESEGEIISSWTVVAHSQVIGGERHTWKRIGF